MKRFFSETGLFFLAISAGPLAACLWHLAVAVGALPEAGLAWLGDDAAAEAYPLYLASDLWLTLSALAAGAAGLHVLRIAPRLPCRRFGPWHVLARVAGALFVTLAGWALLHLGLDWSSRAMLSVWLPVSVLAAVFLHGLSWLSEYLRRYLLGEELPVLARRALVSVAPLVAALSLVVLANRLYGADGRRVDRACELKGHPGALHILEEIAGALPYNGSAHHKRAAAAREAYLAEAEAWARKARRLLAGDRLDEARRSFQRFRKLYPDAPQAAAGGEEIAAIERRGYDLYELVRKMALLQPENLREFFGARGREALEKVGQAYEEISFRQDCTDPGHFRSYRVRVSLDGEELYWANVQTFDDRPLDVWINILDEPFVSRPGNPQEPERALEALEEIVGEWDQVSRRDNQPLRKSNSRCFLAWQDELGYLVKWTKNPSPSRSKLQMTLFTAETKARIRCACQARAQRYESHTCLWEYPPCEGPWR